MPAEMLDNFQCLHRQLHGDADRSAAAAVAALVEPSPAAVG
jgi:hypothetical protein